MINNPKVLLEEALEEAVQQRFCRLFDAFAINPDEESLAKFQVAVGNLVEAYNQTSDMIKRGGRI